MATAKTAPKAATEEPKEEIKNITPYGSYVEKKDDGMVTVSLFKDNGKYKDDVFVAINGKRYQIKRGIPVRVPKEVAFVLEQSMKQDMNTGKMLERYQEDFRKEARKYD